MSTFLYNRVLKFFAVIAFTFALAGNSLFGVNNNQKIEIYPNPVTENFFKIRSNVEIIEVSIINILGEQVFKETFFNKKVIINTGSRKKGLYIIQVKTADKQIVNRRILFKQFS